MILTWGSRLIDTTSVEEPTEVYITKLALSVGRAIVRPKVESELSIQDRHPTRKQRVALILAELICSKVVFIDLVTNYDDILPPTIARKKRESERKVPIRKRTAPVDMRLSRSRISMGADTQQLLAAQQVAQNPSLGKLIKSPELPPLPPSALAASTPFVPPPPPVAEPILSPPPPPPAQIVPPPPPPPISSPPMPSFQEPPPEVEDYPTRPVFKEPPPELYSPPPTRPTFVEPPPEEPSVPSTPAISTSPPVTTVIPPTPQKRASVSSRTGSPSAIRQAAKATSRSPSPGAEDQVLGTGRANISRAGSAGLRSTRPTRGPRPAAGSVSNMVNNLNNRNSGAGSPPIPSSPLSRASHRLSGNPSGRPSSVLSRRTMASDAEDNVVDRK